MAGAVSYKDLSRLAHVMTVIQRRAEILRMLEDNTDLLRAGGWRDCPDSPHMVAPEDSEDWLDCLEVK